MPLYYKNTAVATNVVNRQVDGTCYANAVAAVLRSAMRRIIGREGGVPKFQVILKRIIGKHGLNGGHVHEVLEEWAPRYRLRYQEIDTDAAIEAVRQHRRLVAVFYLTDEQWTIFTEFFEEHPKEAIGISQLPIFGRSNNISRRIDSLPGATGHAVVLRDYDAESDSFTFMNSWGEDFADKGYFRVRRGCLNWKFYDVYWLKEDLLPSEKSAYLRKYGSAARKYRPDLDPDVDYLNSGCALSRRTEMQGAAAAAASAEFRARIGIIGCAADRDDECTIS